jgi:hypothetical protein
MQMIRRLLLSLALIVTALMFTPAPAAFATTCDLYDEAGNCIVEVQDPGQPGDNNPGKPGHNQNVGQCKASWNGIAIPCSLPGIGTYYAAAGCYIRPITGAVPPEAGKPPQPDYKAYNCAFVTGATEMNPRLDTQDITIWLPPVAPTITPEQAARAVAAMMNFEAIKIGISQKMSGPAGVGYVGVPVWLWAKDPIGITVGPQHVSKTYQGIGVTIDAKMTKIVWDLGDGHTATCGQGTPYSTSYGVAESPTCGYRYNQISKSKPGGKYRITATSYWDLDWAAGGQTGTIPLDFTQNTTLSVGEIQVVVSDN